MSGGVDSSVAAWLLKQQGYDVIGILMRNWEQPDDPSCTIEDDALDVQRVCAKLRIPHYTVNFAQAYRERVFAQFLDELQQGRTPNPDVWCNREIKFGELLDQAQLLGATHVATGHYAAIERRDGAYALACSTDRTKDQTYFLHRLTQYQLAHALFPLSAYTKAQIRAMAMELGLSTAHKKDSTGICFIGERHYRSFLQQYFPRTPGNICDATNKKIVGVHEGLMYYTIGQRHGIGIGGGGSGEPWYVVDKNVATNTLYVVQGKSNPHRYAPALLATDVHWISSHAPQTPLRCQAMIRYRQPLQHATVDRLDETQWIVTFDQPQAGIAPGQSVVFYVDTICLGGGTIASAVRDDSP
jgi:tRNA-specific 2-thiouridylase